MTKVYIDETEVVPLLTQKKLPRFTIFEILSAIAGERANVRDGIDAPSVTGFETWRWGVRFLREHEVLQKNGWLICEKDQISGIFHPELNMKLSVMTTDRNTGTSKAPRNLTEKGPATCKLIDLNSGQHMFEFIKSAPPPADLWFLCPYFCDLYIAAEISRPSLQIGGVVRDYSERIIVAKPYDLPGIRKHHSVPEDFAEVARPTIRRKVI